MSLSPPKDRRLQILVLVCLGQFMLLVDDTIVNVALPSIQADLGFTESGLTWVANAYFLALRRLPPPRRQGRRPPRPAPRAHRAPSPRSRPRRRLCGLAPSSGVLVAARGVQGLAGAFLSPAALSILLATFPGAARAHAARSAHGPR